MCRLCSVLASPLILVLIFLGPCLSTARAQLSGKDIVALPPEQRLTVVRAAVRERCERLANLELEELVELRNLRFHDGEIAERKPFIIRHDIHLRALDGSYRETCVETDLSTGTKNWTWKTHYDSPTGVVRGLTILDARKESYARINYQQPERRPNILLEHLPGSFKAVVSRYEQVLNTRWNIPVEDELDRSGDVIVRAWPNPKPQNKMEPVERIWLRPDHDFMIRRYRREDRRFDSNELVLFTDGEVVEEKQVDGVWLPMKVTKVNANLNDNKGLEWIVTVKSASVGKVKPEDLDVVFPDGTEVTDNIQQKAYIQGEEEISTVGFAGQKTYPSPRKILREAEAAKPPGRPWYFWVNLALVVVLGVGLVVLRRRMKATA